MNIRRWEDARTKSVYSHTGKFNPLFVLLASVQHGRLHIRRSIHGYTSSFSWLTCQTPKLVPPSSILHGRFVNKFPSIFILHSCFKQLLWNRKKERRKTFIMLVTIRFQRFSPSAMQGLPRTSDYSSLYRGTHINVFVVDIFNGILMKEARRYDVNLRSHISRAVQKQGQATAAPAKSNSKIYLLQMNWGPRN